MSAKEFLEKLFDEAYRSIANENLVAVFLNLLKHFWENVQGTFKNKFWMKYSLLIAYIG